MFWNSLFFAFEAPISQLFIWRFQNDFFMNKQYVYLQLIKSQCGDDYVSLLQNSKDKIKFVVLLLLNFVVLVSLFALLSTNKSRSGFPKKKNQLSLRDLPIDWIRKREILIEWACCFWRDLQSFAISSHCRALKHTWKHWNMCVKNQIQLCLCIETEQE